MLYYLSLEYQCQSLSVFYNSLKFVQILLLALCLYKNCQGIYVFLVGFLLQILVVDSCYQSSNFASISKSVSRVSFSFSMILSQSCISSSSANSRRSEERRVG